MITFSDERNNLEFKLKISGREFPEITTGDDSNWLIVESTIRTKDLNTNTSSPALEIPDLKDISLWFKSLSEGEKPKWYPELGFMEPCLEFLVEHIDLKKASIGVKLDLEFRPKTKSREDFIMHFTLSRNELKKKSREFYEEYKRYLRINSKTQSVPHSS